MRLTGCGKKGCDGERVLRPMIVDSEEPEVLACSEGEACSGEEPQFARANVSPAPSQSELVKMGV